MATSRQTNIFALYFFPFFCFCILQYRSMTDFPDVDFPERTINEKPFVEVCRSHDVLRRRGTCIIFDDETQIAIFRIGNEAESKLYAISNICLHQHAPILADGVVEQADCTVTCPLHGWTYALNTGKPVEAGVASLRTYEVFEERGVVVLEKPTPIVPDWTW